MNFFEKVVNYFRKKRKKDQFIPINIFVPTREDLIENGQDQMIEMLDKYKREYREKLKQRLLLGNISSRNLIREYLENQDLILEHVKSNPYLHVDELLASGNTKELFDVKIKYLKLFLLSQDKIKLYKEIMLRYAALKEIMNKTTFFSPNKKRAISNEFDFLYHALVVSSSNNFATNKDCQLYLIRIQEINEHLKDTANEDKEYRYERLSLDTKLASYFAKEAKKQAFGHNMDELGIISYLEVELEKYFYEHKDEFEKLDEGLSEIEAIKCTSENKKYLEKMIERLEIKYLLLNLIKGVSKETMTRLYQKKFEILTCDMSLSDEHVIDPKDYGYEYYTKFVKDKVDNILSGNNACFNRQIDLNSFRNKFIKYYSDIDEVLLGKQKLATLLSFDQENGFSKLLNKIMVKIDDRETVYQYWPIKYFDKYEELFLRQKFSGYDTCGLVWNDEIPLESILRMKELFSFPCASFLENVYHHKYKNRYYFQFPEGIKIINFSQLLDFYFTLSRKKLLFPSSLEQVKNVREGMHYEILDFKQSSLLNDKEKLMEFLKTHCVEISGSYRSRTSSSFIGCTYETVYYTRGYKMKKFSLIIYDDNRNPIQIDFGNDQSPLLQIPSFYPSELYQQFLERKAQELRDSIKEKTGYSIFQDNYQHKGYKVLNKKR